MANERYNRLNNQAPVQTQLESSKVNVGRSAFDFSCIHSGNAMMGMLAPVDVFDVVPNEDIDVDISALLELRNPLNRNILNGMRVYFHTYISYLVDLWEGAKNFLDAGRSGKISLERPNLVYSASFTAGSSTVRCNASTPMSLLNFLGLPPRAFTRNVSSSGSVETDVFAKPLYQFAAAFDYYNDSGTNVLYLPTLGTLNNSSNFFPADCAFMYQKIWRDYYSNQNLLQGNKAWFPDNEDHFILSYSCTAACAIRYEDENFVGVSSSANEQGKARFQNIVGLLHSNVSATDFVNSVFSSVRASYCPVSSATSDPVAKDYPNLSAIKFRQFRGDRFTAASPFPDIIRGDIPLLNDVSDTRALQLVYRNGTVADFGFDGTPQSVSPASVHLAVAADGSSYFNDTGTANPPNGNAVGDFILRVKNGSSAITMNDIRALETMTVFKERMARTSGEYNDMIEAQFGYNPHHHIRKPEYIGGFYQDFVFNSVLQTSQTTESSPLGSKAGQGLSQGQGRIGHVHTRDYGWIMTIMSIVPDVMYTQGVPRMFSKKTQLEMYFPVFNNLAPQAILNKELYVSGNAAVDNDVFAYEDRYAEYKSRPNRVSGFMSLSHKLAEYDASKIMARRFSATPQFNSTFVTMIPQNMDMSVFAVEDEPPFDFQVGIKVRRVFPGPYTAVPGSMSSNLHA